MDLGWDFFSINSFIHLLEGSQLLSGNKTFSLLIKRLREHERYELDPFVTLKTEES